MTVLERLRLAPILAALLACAPHQAEPDEWSLEPSLVFQTSGTTAQLIAVSPVDRDTVWVSGAGGSFARTTDGGMTWTAATVAGADSLQFRDVHAVDGSTAYLLSIGSGQQSRIYKTTDSGATWSLQFTNPEPAGFFDCFGFWDGDHGIAFSDSFDGRHYLITTDDGGRTWTRIPAEQLPPANPGEGSFASSGTCLVVHGVGSAWIGTGASALGARVLRTTDRGVTWSVANTAIVAGPAAGIATLAFRNALDGAALGGDIGQPADFSDNVAITRDGGLSWETRTHSPFPGAAYGSSWVPGAPAPTLVAVGPGGLALTTDHAVTWTQLDTLNHWGVAFAAPDAGWAVGPHGRITRLNLYRPR